MSGGCRRAKCPAAHRWCGSFTRALFVARYVAAMDDDPLRNHTHATGRGVYNLGLMSAEEWRDTRIYHEAFRLHRMDHVMEVPAIASGQIVGALHYAASGSRTDDSLRRWSQPKRDFGPSDLRVAEAVAGVLGRTITRIQSGGGVESERDEALTALDLAGTAVVTSRPDATELGTNPAADHLLSEVVDAEEHLHALIAPPPVQRRFSRRADVELVGGESAVLHAYSELTGYGSVVTVLELQRQHSVVAPELLASLTPREAEVATLIAEGLSDREIADRLCVSYHTVTQHAKSIYRKVDVGSRVSLTRLMLGAHSSARRT
jgi:DNA-binding CsgD family transcriptional regulator